MLLIGCGELGSRHLQAIVRAPSVTRVIVVDPSERALAEGRTRVEQVTDRNPAIAITWATALAPAHTGGDLCIVATRAAERPSIVQEAGRALGYREFLIEKIVSQSVDEYRDLLAWAAQNTAHIWVNCKTRAYGVHRFIKAKIAPGTPMMFSRIAGNFGLASNGIHAADLFCFYTDATRIRLVGERIDALVHASKRTGEYDLSGCLYGTTDTGSDCILACSAHHMSPDAITITTACGRFFIDHFSQQAWESSPEDDWRWHPLPIHENWLVSTMTTTFAEDILTKGTCALPTLEACFPAHEFILDTLLPHFNRLQHTAGNRCPVT